jgi:hypothetical protein
MFLQFMEFLGKRIDRNKNDEAVRELYDAVVNQKGRLERITFGFGQARQSGDIDGPLLSATPYLRMFGNLLMAWQLTDQAAIAHRRLEEICTDSGATDDDARKALIAEDETAAFYHNKTQTARFFIRQILPENDWLAAGIESGDRSALEVCF